MKIIIYSKIVVAHNMSCIDNDIFNKQTEKSI